MVVANLLKDKAKMFRTSVLIIMSNNNERLKKGFALLKIQICFTKRVKRQNISKI